MISRFQSFLIVAGAAAALAACASAPEQSGPMSTAQLALGDSSQTYARATEAERNRLICRREVAVGSNRPQRICMTLAERDRLRQAAEENRRNMESRTTSCGETGSCGGI